MEIDYWRYCCNLNADELLGLESSLTALLIMERYWNDGSPSGFNSGFQSEYSPKAETQFVDIPVVSVPRAKITTLGYVPSEFRDSADSAFVKFPMHPHTLTEHNLRRVDGQKYAVDYYFKGVPTASLRTVARLPTESGTSHFLKLHYSGVIGRFDRRLQLFKWIASLERSSLLKEASANLKGYALSETGGSYFEDCTDPHGFIYREGLSFYPKKLVVPGFSLWAKPPRGKCTILAALSRMLGTTPLELARNMIVGLVEDYWTLALKHGLLPEINAQNVLFEIDSTRMEIRPIFRDMQDVYVDNVVRSNRDLNVSKCSYKSLDDRSSDLKERRSFSFDFKLCRYLILPLQRHAEKLEKLNPDTSSLPKEIREISRERLQENKGYFSSDEIWYSYQSVKDPSATGYLPNSGVIYR